MSDNQPGRREEGVHGPEPTPEPAQPQLAEGRAPTWVVNLTVGTLDFLGEANGVPVQQFQPVPGQFAVLTNGVQPVGVRNRAC